MRTRNDDKPVDDVAAMYTGVERCSDAIRAGWIGIERIDDGVGIVAPARENDPVTILALAGASIAEGAPMNACNYRIALAQCVIDDNRGNRVQTDVATVNVGCDFEFDGQLLPDQAAVANRILRAAAVSADFAQPVVEDAGIHARASLSRARAPRRNRDINLIIGEDR